MLLFGVFGALPAQAAWPALQPGERPDPSSTEAELWYGMDQAERDLRDSPLLERDPALNAYVKDVLCKVSGPHCEGLRLYVLRLPQFNAAMAPNGATLVFTGALLRLRDEDELAMLLGHEFAHYRQRHSLQQWERSKRTTAALSTLGVVSFGAGVGLIGNAAGLLGAAGLSSNSREAEREADTLGAQLAAAAGYSPQAAASLWQRLLEEEQARRPRVRGGIFATHPRTAERLRRLQSQAEHAASPARQREPYQVAITPFIAPWLDAELSQRTASSSVVMLDSLHRNAPPSWQADTARALATALRRRAQPGDAERAAALEPAP